MTEPKTGPRSRVENIRHGRLEGNSDPRLSVNPHEVHSYAPNPSIGGLGHAYRKPDVPDAMKGMYYCG